MSMQRQFSFSNFENLYSKFFQNSLHQYSIVKGILLKLFQVIIIYRFIYLFIYLSIEEDLKQI